MPEKSDHNLLIFRSITGVLVVGMTVALVWWTMLPYLQLRALYADAQSGQDAFIADDFLYTPYTFVQPILRYQLLEYVFDEYKKGTPELGAHVLPFAINKLEESVRREPFYPKYYFSLGKAYRLLAAERGDDKALYQRSDENYKKALTLIPGEQEITYAYAIGIVSQNRFDEAIALMRSVVEEDPRVAESHYYYGVILFKAGESHYAEALAEFETALSKGKNIDATVSYNIYSAFFTYFHRTRDATHFLTTVNRLIELDPSQRDEYRALKIYVEAHHTVPAVTIKQS